MSCVSCTRRSMCFYLCFRSCCLCELFLSVSVRCWFVSVRCWCVCVSLCLAGSRAADWLTDYVGDLSIPHHLPVEVAVAPLEVFVEEELICEGVGTPWTGEDLSLRRL